MARPEKTDPVPVCLDADVLIAGLLSCTGASHAILVLGEIGPLHLVLPEAAVEEVRRNLSAKLPEAVPLFEEFLRAVPVTIHRPSLRDRDRAHVLECLMAAWSSRVGRLSRDLPRSSRQIAIFRAISEQATRGALTTRLPVRRP